MSQPGRRMYSMYARSDRGCKGELAQSLRDRNQAQRNFQFRSRAKTSKEGNNGVDKKDWILKKSLDSFYTGWRLEMSSTLLSVIQKGSKIKSIILCWLESRINQIRRPNICLHLWKSDKITEIFISLNYLAVVYPQLQILLPQSSMLSIQFTDLMTSVPSRDKNKLSALSSFYQFGSCTTLKTLDRPLRLPPQD